MICPNCGHRIPTRKKEADPRHDPIREFIKNLQAETGTPEQWDGRCARALSSLLKASPNLTVEAAQALIRNRFDSDEPRGAPPWEWLPKLAKYSEGPLDKFSKVWRPDFRAGLGYR